MVGIWVKWVIIYYCYLVISFPIPCRVGTTKAGTVALVLVSGLMGDLLCIFGLFKALLQAGAVTQNNTNTILHVVLSIITGT